MGGFIPIHLPNYGDPGGPGEGVRSLGDALAGLADFRRQQRIDQQNAELAKAREAREAWKDQAYYQQVQGQIAGQERARQAADHDLEVERAGVRSKAGELFRQGRMNEAHNLLQSYGMTFSGDAGAPQSENPAGQHQPPSLVGDPGSPAPGLAPSSGPPSAPAENPIVKARRLERERGGPMAPQPPTAGPTGLPALQLTPPAMLSYGDAPSSSIGVQAIMAARAAERDRGRRPADMVTGNARPSNTVPVTGQDGGGPIAPSQPVYKVTDQSGKTYVIDPYEADRAQTAQRQRRLAEIDAEMGKSPDPFTHRYYQAVRPAIAAGVIKPEEAFDKMAELRRLDDANQRAAMHRRGAGRGTGRPEKPPTEGQSKFAFLGQQMLDDLTTLDRMPQLTDDELSTMQRNGNRAEAADRSATSGIIPSLVVGGARALGAVPQSKYEGLSSDAQVTANAWDNVTEKYARLLTGAGMPADEARRMALQDSPHAGDSPEVRAQKHDRMRNAASQIMSLSGPAGPRVQAAHPRPMAAQPGAADRKAIDWARSHPNDPRSKAILQANGVNE